MNKDIYSIGDAVVKRSGKPFKSGAKTAVISGFGKKTFPPAANRVNHELVEKDVYFFSTEEEDYFVVASQCERIG